MAAKLKSLTSTSASSVSAAGESTIMTPTALGERVVATSALAGLLSYLCFAHAGASLGGSDGERLANSTTRAYIGVCGLSC